MKTSYTITLVLAMAAAMLLATPLPCGAVKETEQENIWLEDEPNRQPTEWPGKELRGRRRERLKKEWREWMHERPEKERWERMHERPKKEIREGKRSRSRGRTGMRERHAEHLEWLGKNYPKEARELAGLREGKPELYTRRLGLCLKRYGRIMEAAKENPELAQALKEDLELKKKRDKLLRKIRTAADDGEKKKLVKKLEEVISGRFELIVKRKQIRYEQMRRKLEKLEARVKRSEAKVKKWQDVKFRNESVKARLKELVGETEKFKWD